MADSGTETLSIAYKVFTFEDERKNARESLCVSIPEVCPVNVILYRMYSNRKYTQSEKLMLYYKLNSLLCCLEIDVLAP